MRSPMAHMQASQWQLTDQRFVATVRDAALIIAAYQQPDRTMSIMKFRRALSVSCHGNPIRKQLQSMSGGKSHSASAAHLAILPLIKHAAKPLLLCGLLPRAIGGT